MTDPIGVGEAFDRFTRGHLLSDDAERAARAALAWGDCIANRTAFAPRALLDDEPTWESFQKYLVRELVEETHRKGYSLVTNPTIHTRPAYGGFTDGGVEVHVQALTRPLLMSAPSRAAR